MAKEKLTNEGKQEIKKANQALNHLITTAKKKGAFISEELINNKQPKLF